jgi:hypothetical protein
MSIHIQNISGCKDIVFFFIHREEKTQSSISFLLFQGQYFVFMSKRIRLLLSHQDPSDKILYV